MLTAVSHPAHFFTGTSASAVMWKQCLALQLPDELALMVHKHLIHFYCMHLLKCIEECRNWFDKRQYSGDTPLWPFDKQAYWDMHDFCRIGLKLLRASCDKYEIVNLLHMSWYEGMMWPWHDVYAYQRLEHIICGNMNHMYGMGHNSHVT